LPQSFQPQQTDISQKPEPEKTLGEWTDIRQKFPPQSQKPKKVHQRDKPLALPMTARRDGASTAIAPPLKHQLAVFHSPARLAYDLQVLRDLFGVTGLRLHSNMHYFILPRNGAKTLAER